MKLLVAGTSHLIPGNQAWRALASKHEVIFGEYNEWSDLLLRGGPRLQEVEVVVWVVALDDLFPLDAPGPDAGGDGQGGTLDLVLEPLRAALARADGRKFIVAWSCPLVASPILTARRPGGFWDEKGLAFESALREMQRQHGSLFLVPLNRVFAQVGMLGCLDARNFYAASCRYSLRGLQSIAGSIASLLERFRTAPRKVLVLDCDNTLWGGVIGEEGLPGIVLGQDGPGRAFVDFQRAVKRLAADGVLLALASKNNEQDVWPVFEQHPAMVLKRSDFIAAQINWSEKVANLTRLAEELSLGLDSLLFWDDNPLERELVRRQCPDIAVPEIPNDVGEWPRTLLGLEAFHRFESTEEDRQKLSQYRARSQFQTGLRTAQDESGFLASLGLRPRAIPLEAGLLGRAEQLCTKTNQFNLRTCRHGLAELQALSRDPKTVLFLTHLADRFGEHGHVGLVIAQMDASGESAFLDTFLISCRVLGRHLEAWMLDRCAARLREMGCKRLIGEFVPTERNSPAKDFLGTHGLVPVPESEQESLRRLFPQTKPEGHPYWARLDGLMVPHMEIYAAQA